MNYLRIKNKKKSTPKLIFKNKLNLFNFNEVQKRNDLLRYYNNFIFSQETNQKLVEHLILILYKHFKFTHTSPIFTKNRGLFKKIPYQYKKSIIDFFNLSRLKYILLSIRPLEDEYMLHSFICNEFIPLNELKHTMLLRKLIAKDIYHYFYHYLNFEKWNYDLWIPIPLK